MHKPIIPAAEVRGNDTCNSFCLTFLCRPKVVRRAHFSHRSSVELILSDRAKTITGVTPDFEVTGFTVDRVPWGLTVSCGNVRFHIYSN